MIAFGDADLRTLYITTAKRPLDPVARARDTLAGALLATRVDVPGLAAPLFKPDAVMRVGAWENLA